MILDVGTGTGIWAIDMADQNASVSVIGVDLSPIQPEFVPPNCSFEVDDVDDEWTYPDNHFDFIFIRELFGSITSWDIFFREVFRCTRPGGWVEVVERGVEVLSDDGTIPPDHVYHKFNQIMVQIGERGGKSLEIWRESKRRVLSAGFVDVVESKYKWPLNGWPKDPKWREIGKINQLRLNLGLEGYMLRLLTTVGRVSR